MSIAKYSNREIKMFTALGQYDLLLHNIVPTAVYKTAVDHAFVNDMKGPAVDALRRTYRALWDCSAYRMTAQWDDLIGEL